MAANNIYIQVDLNSQTAQQNVNALNQAIANTGTEAEKSSEKGSKALTGLQLNINQTTKAFGELGTALAGLGIARAMQQIVQQSAQFSRAQTAIELFAGSAEKAATVIGQVRAIAAQSPFHFADLQESARQLLAFGIAAKDVPIHLKAITDQVTAMGGSMEDVSGIVRIYGRIMEKDMVSAMDLIRKLPVEGVPIMKAFRDEMSKALSRPVDTKDVQEAMKKGLFDPQQTLRLLTESMGKTKVPINDAAAAFKNLGDTIKLALFGPEGLFGPKGFGPAFTKLAQDIQACLVPLESFIDLLKSLPEPAKEWIVRLAALGVGMTALAGGAAVAATVFGPLITAIGGFIALLPEVLTVIGALAGIGAILYKTVPGIRQWADNIKDNIDGLKVKAGELQQSIADALNPQKLAHGNIFNLAAVADELNKVAEKTRQTADASKRSLLDAFSSPVEAVKIKYADLYTKLEEESRLFTDDQKRYLREVLQEGEAADLAGARFKVEKQNIDELAKYQAEKVKGSYEAQIAYIEALDEQGVQKRVAAIDKITQLRMESAQKVADVEKDHLTQIYDAQAKLLEQSGLDPDQVFAAETELYKKLTAARALLDEKAADESNKYRLEGWKKANDVIIEDQKRVFDNFKSGFDQMFDILTGKSKDMGKAMSDFFKKELLGEARNIFSTVLAQGATQAAGYGRPEADFRRTGGIFSSFFLRGTPPRPPGAPPDIFTPARGEATLKDYQGGEANRTMTNSAHTFDNSTQLFALAVQQFASTAGVSQDQTGGASLPGKFGSQFRRYITSPQGGLTGPEPRIILGPIQSQQAVPIAAPDFPAFLAPGTSGLSTLGTRAVSGPAPLPASTLATATTAAAYTGDIFNLPTTQAPFIMPTALETPSATSGIDIMGLPTQQRNNLQVLATIAGAYKQQGTDFWKKAMGWFGGSYAGSGGLSRVGTNISQYAGAFNAPGATTAAKLQALSTGPLAGTPAGPAAGAIGMMIAQAGIFGENRGTAAGLAEAAGGGFLVAGPIGAAVGAGIGLGEMIAGVESPRRQAVRLAASLYHININNATADRIVDIANQSYGGRVSVAIRAPEVRQMLGLYAAGTGQANRFNEGFGQAHGASLVESGGTLSQQATYQYGNAYSYGSSLPIYGGQPTHILGAPGGGVQLSLNIDGSSAAKFLQGNVVSPDVVQTQYATAMQNSNGRVSQALMMTSPGMITGTVAG